MMLLRNTKYASVSDLSRLVSFGRCQTRVDGDTEDIGT